LSGLFLNGSFLKFNGGGGSGMVLRFNGIYQTAGEQGGELIGKTIPMTILSVLIPVISLLTILLYKNRKLQIKFALVLLILEVLLIGIIAYYALISIQNKNVTLVPVINTFIPVVTIILSILAYRGIKNDDKIVKSYDRLR
jgi:phosphoglycerol transferase MdoB-like AlkP superfamily enzyme